MARRMVLLKRMVFFCLAGLLAISSARIIAKENRFPAPTPEAAQAKSPCEDAAAIRKAVLAKIAADPSFNVACKHNAPGQPVHWKKDSDHIAAEVKGGKITLVGFVIAPGGAKKDSETLIKKAVSLARSASPCKNVASELRPTKDEGCSRVQFTCTNGLCVSDQASCP